MWMKIEKKKPNDCGWNFIHKMTECHNMDEFITTGIGILLAQNVNEIWFLVYNHLNSLKLI